MLARLRITFLMLVLVLGTFFGRSTLGPFTTAEIADAEQVYHSRVQHLFEDKLKQVSASTALYSVGFDGAFIRQIHFEPMRVIRNYNLVLETSQSTGLYYKIKLVDRELNCYGKFNATAVFFKEHGQIKLASVYLVPVGPSSCSTGLLEASR